VETKHINIIKDINMECISKFLTLQNQLRIHHWQTPSYAEHKALGKAYEMLDRLIDSFIETYMGKYGKDTEQERSITLHGYEKSHPMPVLNYFENYLKTELTSDISEDDTELLNIRDEMLSVVNTTKYLLTLK
jgi:hypothetical protein